MRIVIRGLTGSLHSSFNGEDISDTVSWFRTALISPFLTCESVLVDAAWLIMASQVTYYTRNVLSCQLLIATRFGHHAIPLDDCIGRLFSLIPSKVVCKFISRPESRMGK